LDDRKRDGGTKYTLRTKEQGTHLTLNEHDDDDDDDEDDVMYYFINFVVKFIVKKQPSNNFCSISLP